MSQGFGYGKCCFTHIHRLAQRWGLTNGKKIISTQLEKDFEKNMILKW